jgi:hypothetical protein
VFLDLFSVFRLVKFLEADHPVVNYCVKRGINSIYQLCELYTRVPHTSCSYLTFQFFSYKLGKMEWLYGYLDTWDIVILTLIAIVAGYFYLNQRADNPPDSSSSGMANGSAVTAQKADKSFLGRMKSENRQVLILFGSQTGTGEELAGRLAKDLHRYGKKPLVMDPEEIDIEDLPKITGELQIPFTNLLLFFRN